MAKKQRNPARLGAYAIKMPDGTLAPLVASPAEWKRITGDPRSENAIRTDCDHGVLPVLARPGASGGGHYRIPVAKALAILGVHVEVVPVKAAS